MSERLAELSDLWKRQLEGGLDAASQARLNVLMQDAELVEAFSAQAPAAAAGEEAAGMDEAAWAALDQRVISGFRRYKAKLWLKPLAILAAASLALAGGFWFAETAKERPSLELESGSFKSEVPQRHVPIAAAEPQGTHEVRAAKISVVVDQPENGPASVLIYNASGALVRSLYSGELDKGRYRLEWNGEDASGRKAAPGAYRIEIKSSAGRETRSLEIRRKK